MYTLVTDFVKLIIMQACGPACLTEFVKLIIIRVCGPDCLAGQK